MSRVSRSGFVLACSLASFAAVSTACSGPNPYQAAASSTVAGDGAAVGDNGFIPDRNIGECVGLVERPNCGSESKGGLGMTLTFVALLLGLGVVLGRIAFSVRRRDAQVNRPVEPGA
jgi:hypothetical protein